jgi:hypothetical protein
MSLMANLRRSSLTKRSGAPSPSIWWCARRPCARFSTSAVCSSNSSGRNFARPLFPAALRDARCQLREHGAAAGFLLRSRALAEDLLPNVYGLAKDTNTDAALRHRVFESLARYALLNPATKKDNVEGGVRVIFSIALGKRGMLHVTGRMRLASCCRSREVSTRGSSLMACHGAADRSSRFARCRCVSE